MVAFQAPVEWSGVVGLGFSSFAMWDPHCLWHDSSPIKPSSLSVLDLSYFFSLKDWVVVAPLFVVGCLPSLFLFGFQIEVVFNWKIFTIILV